MIDRREDARQGAETGQQPHRRERLAGRPGGGAELAAEPGEQPWLGALEREDRLLFIADAENGARPVDGAVAGEDLALQLLDHPPLLGIGVLALVDQNVGDAGVELVAYPVRRRAIEQPDDALDQIVEIEPGAGPLLPLVTRDDGGQEIEQRFAALDQQGGGELLLQLADARLLDGEQHIGGRILLPQRLGEKRAARRALFGEEGGEQVVGRGTARGTGGEQIDEAVATAASAQRHALRMPLRRRQRPAADDFSTDVVRLPTRIEPRHAAQFALGARQVGEHAPQLAAGRQRLVDRRVEAMVAEQPEQSFHRLGDRMSAAQAFGDHRLPGMPHQRIGLDILDDGKIERHPGF